MAPNGTTLNLTDLFSVERWRKLHGFPNIDINGEIPSKQLGGVSEQPASYYPEEDEEDYLEECIADETISSLDSSPRRWQRFPDPAKALALKWRLQRQIGLMEKFREPLSLCRADIANSARHLRECRSVFEEHEARGEAMRALLSKGGICLWSDSDFWRESPTGRCPGRARCFFCRERAALEKAEVISSRGNSPPRHEALNGTDPPEFLVKLPQPDSAEAEDSASSDPCQAAVPQKTVKTWRRTPRQRGEKLFKHSVAPAVTKAPNPAPDQAQDTWYARHTEEPTSPFRKHLRRPSSSSSKDKIADLIQGGEVQKKWDDAEMQRASNEIIDQFIGQGLTLTPRSGVSSPAMADEMDEIQTIPPDSPQEHLADVVLSREDSLPPPPPPSSLPSIKSDPAHASSSGIVGETIVIKSDPAHASSSGIVGETIVMVHQPSPPSLDISRRRSPQESFQDATLQDPMSSLPPIYPPAEDLSLPLTQTTTPNVSLGQQLQISSLPPPPPSVTAQHQPNTDDSQVVGDKLEQKVPILDRPNASKSEIAGNKGMKAIHKSPGVEMHVKEPADTPKSVELSPSRVIKVDVDESLVVAESVVVDGSRMASSASPPSTSSPANKSGSKSASKASARAARAGFDLDVESSTADVVKSDQGVGDLIKGTSSMTKVKKRYSAPREVKLSPLARANKRSTKDEVRKVFNEIQGEDEGDGIQFEHLDEYLAKYLGYGLAEVSRFFSKHTSDNERVTFENFQTGYALLNPYFIAQQRGEIIFRKPGSICGQAMNLEGLNACEVYVCDMTAQVFVDDCHDCQILLGPCESATYIRDCKDCTLWIAAQQLRTVNCSRCTIYLHSKTDPCIEKSTDMSFAPWNASYPGCSQQFKQMGFDTNQNMWNAIFDFSGKTDHSNWRIVPLDECKALTVELDEPAELVLPCSNPAPVLSHEVLCKAPLVSTESTGRGLNIPQTRPALPAVPLMATKPQEIIARDSMPAVQPLTNVTDTEKVSQSKLQPVQRQPDVGFSAEDLAQRLEKEARKRAREEMRRQAIEEAEDAARKLTDSSEVGDQEKQRTLAEADADTRKASEEEQKLQEEEQKVKREEQELAGEIRKAMEESEREKKRQEMEHKREREEAERKRKEEMERKAKEDAEKEAKLEAEMKAKEEAARKAKELAERRAKEEADREAKEQAERAKAAAAAAAKDEAERLAKMEAERMAMEAKQRAEEEAKIKAKEEAESQRKAKEEAERLVKEEAESKAKEEALKKARDETERLAREEAERKAQEDAARKAKEEQKAKEEALQKAREETERLAREEAERKAQEEVARKAKEEQKAKEEAERLAREKEDRKVKEQEEQKRAEDEEKRRAEEQVLAAEIRTMKETFAEVGAAKTAESKGAEVGSEESDESSTSESGSETEIEMETEDKEGDKGSRPKVTKVKLEEQNEGTKNQSVSEKTHVAASQGSGKSPSQEQSRSLEEDDDPMRIRVFEGPQEEKDMEARRRMREKYHEQRAKLQSKSEEEIRQEAIETRGKEEEEVEITSQASLQARQRIGAEEEAIKKKGQDDDSAARKRAAEEEEGEEEARRAREEAVRKQQEEKRRRQIEKEEEAAQKEAEEAARERAAKEEEARRAKEEAERKQQEEEARRRRAEEEEARRQAQEEMERRQQEEEAARQQAQDEAEERTRQEIARLQREEEDAAMARRLAAAEEVSDVSIPVSDSRANPASPAQGTSPASQVGPSGHVAAPKAKQQKKGFFSKLFGKKDKAASSSSSDRATSAPATSVPSRTSRQQQPASSSAGPSQRQRSQMASQAAQPAPPAPPAAAAAARPAPQVPAAAPVVGPNCPACTFFFEAGIMQCEECGAVASADPSGRPGEAQAAVQASRPDRSGPWTCATCTFAENRSGEVCEVCGAARPPHDAAEAWSCVLCTFLNDGRANRCEGCGSERT